MEDIDLNIDNYRLNDLIELFKISNNFTEDDMKNAKKIVLKLHPDKSKLDKKYFLFFSKAYKIIYGIYEFRQRSNIKDTEYKVIENSNKEIIKNALESKTVKKDFNKWFNELFEKAKIDNEFTQTGYDDWLKSNKDCEDYMGLNREQQESILEKKRKELRHLILYDEIEDIQKKGSSLTGEKPDNYSSDIFSNLPYEDLKKAHTETIIPITKEDLDKIKYKNLSDIKKERNEKLKVLSYNESQEYLSNINNKNNIKDVERAYNLVKQDEINKKVNDKFLSSIKMIR